MSTFNQHKKKNKTKQNKGSFVQRTGDQAEVYQIPTFDFEWPAVSELGPKITLLGPSSEIHAFKFESVNGRRTPF